MARIPDKTLQWLYSVLGEYHDPRRTYSDAVATLSTYPSFGPRTEVYHHDDGSSTLLLTLTGTVPAVFRGTTYNFPLKLWIPHSYPLAGPIVYINPGEGMQVRRGQHVDPQGRVYHPYLRDWRQIRGGMAGIVVELLTELARAFEKEPPVVAKQQQQQQYHRQQQQQQPSAHASPGPPSLPPKPGRPTSTAPIEMPSTGTPPPRPPKPGDEYTASPQPMQQGRDHSRNGPPLPPLPGEQPSSMRPPPAQNYPNGINAAHRVHPGTHQYQQPTNHERSPVSPVSPVAPRRDNRYAHVSPPPSLPQMQPMQPQPYPTQPATQPSQFYPYQQSASIQQPYQQRPPQPQHTGQNQMPLSMQQPLRAEQPKPPAPDLLTDPFDITLPAQPIDNGPPPPIPPNPQKENLIALISQSLCQQAQQKVSQHLSFIEPLQAQQVALLSAHDRLQNEMAQLEHLSSTLATNEAILRHSIQDCDRAISEAERKPQPPIDDVLVPTTVVANQLWNLCADEAAIREAMYLLQKGVDRGRVSGQDFVRHMRALGREAFLKKAQARRCARGLGLEVG
ncbi:UEV-domain-containing protein [Polychaeton citri CBS 116435]|uniref:UEV-domain-containing protein n=1 Tax=Polychaeton citri CBS 116435 TaxID=1314669 RepID=A0A9P4QEL1_9PEZI|nr:UEV-domain-containing protein [Polychaeton citri CBS 116435]